MPVSVNIVILDVCGMHGVCCVSSGSPVMSNFTTSMSLGAHLATVVWEVAYFTAYVCLVMFALILLTLMEAEWSLSLDVTCSLWSETFVLHAHAHVPSKQTSNSLRLFHTCFVAPVACEKIMMIVC